MFKHVQCSNDCVHFPSCITVLLCTFCQCYFCIFSHRIMWGSGDMFGYVAHVRTATSAYSLFHAVAKEFRRNTLLQLLKTFTNASDKSNSLSQRPRPWQLVRNRTTLKGHLRSRRGTLLPEALSFWTQTQTTLGFSVLPNLAHPASHRMLMLPTSSGSNTERDTCTSELFKKSSCMIKRNI